MSKSYINQHCVLCNKQVITSSSVRSPSSELVLISWDLERVRDILYAADLTKERKTNPAINPAPAEAAATTTVDVDIIKNLKYTCISLERILTVCTLTNIHVDVLWHFDVQPHLNRDSFEQINIEPSVCLCMDLQGIMLINTMGFVCIVTDGIQPLWSCRLMFY